MAAQSTLPIQGPALQTQKSSWRMEPSWTLCLLLTCDRSMAHYNCEIKAVLGQALIALKSTEERDNVVGICIITEVSLSPLWWPSLPRSLIQNIYVWPLCVSYASW